MDFGLDLFVKNSRPTSDLSTLKVKQKPNWNTSKQKIIKLRSISSSSSSYLHVEMQHSINRSTMVWKNISEQYYSPPTSLTP